MTKQTIEKVQDTFYHVFNAASFNEFADASVGRNLPKCEAHMFRDRGGWSGSKEWFGGRVPTSIAHAREILRKPWDYATRRVKGFHEEILRMPLPEPKSPCRRRRNSEFDGEVNCDRFLNGESDFYDGFVREQKLGPKLITLFVDMRITSGDDADAGLWACAGSIALTDILETQGFDVEIVCYHATRDTHDGRNSEDNANASFTSFVAKEAGMPVDVSTLGSIISPMTARTIDLHWNWGNPCSDRPCHFCGSTDYLGGRSPELFYPTNNRFFIIRNLFSREGTRTMISKVVNEMNETLSLES